MSVEQPKAAHSLTTHQSGTFAAWFNRPDSRDVVRRLRSHLKESVDPAAVRVFEATLRDAGPRAATACLRREVHSHELDRLMEIWKYPATVRDVVLAALEFRCFRHMIRIGETGSVGLYIERDFDLHLFRAFLRAYGQPTAAAEFGGLLLATKCFVGAGVGIEITAAGWPRVRCYLVSTPGLPWRRAAAALAGPAREHLEDSADQLSAYVERGAFDVMVVNAESVACRVAVKVEAPVSTIQEAIEFLGGTWTAEQQRDIVDQFGDFPRYAGIRIAHSGDIARSLYMNVTGCDWGAHDVVY